MILQYLLTYASYEGIVSDAQQGSYISEKKLAGGAWLDLLFIVVLSQFGSLFIHEGFMDSMLVVLPLLYALKNYLTRAWGGDGDEPTLTKQDEETRKLLEERRRKRAERRRQKRG